MFNFTGKTALVAGGLGLIGRPTVKLLKELGCNVFIADTRAEEPIDVSDYHCISNYISGCVPDYFINCTYTEFIENHLQSFLVPARVMAKAMWKKGGVIINLSSIYGVINPHYWLYPYSGVKPPSDEYCVVKEEIIRMSIDMAKAFKGRIRVNCVSPGGVIDCQSAEFQWAYNSIAPMVDAEDVAQAIVFLVGCEGVTGVNLLVDRGFTL